MNNQLLTTGMCGFPILAGAIAYILSSKGDSEKRIRNMLWWSISAISVPWLFYLWRSMSDNLNDVKIIGWSLLVCVPIWLTWLILFNKGEKYTKASRVVLLVCVLPLYAYVFRNLFTFLSKFFAMREVELFVYTSMFGMFLILGIWVRDYKVILFRDK